VRIRKIERERKKERKPTDQTVRISKRKTNQKGKGTKKKEEKKRRKEAKKKRIENTIHKKATLQLLD